ncbi:hypothetical protein [Listeria rocourtiae]|uniref:hypothetical protein n=1 Tax=Listeria rocourtiae TaxID=647910 RepID=UPI003D2F8970
MNIIKKGDVVKAKILTFLIEPNGSLATHNKGSKFRVTKIYNSKMLKVKSLSGIDEGTVLVSSIEVMG